MIVQAVEQLSKDSRWLNIMAECEGAWCLPRHALAQQQLTTLLQQLDKQHALDSSQLALIRHFYTDLLVSKHACTTTKAYHIRNPDSETLLDTLATAFVAALQVCCQMLQACLSRECQLDCTRQLQTLSSSSAGQSTWLQWHGVSRQSDACL